MDRRHYLLSVANLEKYREYLFNYVYYNIIPDTIDSKNVKDIGKAKLLEIQGNSEVVNQLVIDGNFTSSTGWYTIASSGTITVSNSIAKVTKTTSSTIYLYRANSDYPTLTNHKYLHTAWVKLSANGTARFTCGNSYMTPQSITANTWTKISFIASPTTFGGFFSDVEDSNSLSIGETMEVKEYQVIDLTKEYPFDTPTTLTDNRVQAILNRGYIPHNTGEIKDSIVSEIDFKPYNLLNTNEIIKGKQITSTGVIQDNSASCYVLIKTVPNKQYTLEVGNGTTAVMLVYFDKDGNMISRSANQGLQTRDITTPSECVITGITCWSDKDFLDTACFHRTGTRIGYAPYKAPTSISLPAPLQLGGVNTSHNTFAVTSSAYVFTRNMWKVDLGTLGYGGAGTSQDGTKIRVSSSGFSSLASLGNSLVGQKGLTSATGGISADSPANLVSTKTYQNIIYVNLNIAQIGWDGQSSTLNSTVKSYLNGVIMDYQLATPQVITIPRRHLAIKKVREVNWNMSGTVSGRFSAQNFPNLKITGSTTIMGNAYMACYMGTTQSLMNTSTPPNMSWSVHNSDPTFFIYDNRYNSVNDFLNAHGDDYIFYETESEVEDFITKAKCERGGTISTSEFSWVENQQAILPTISTQELNGITLTNNGDGSVTISGTANAQTTFTLMGNLSRDIPLGNKVFIANFANPSQSTYHLYDAYESNLTSAMVSSPYGYIKTKEGSSTIISPRIRVENGTVLFEPQKVYVMYFDLTLGFGAGNEPTSVDDWRIQYILEHGYLPTNTSGTLKSIDTEVLCDIDTKLQVE